MMRRVANKKRKQGP